MISPDRNHYFSGLLKNNLDMNKLKQQTYTFDETTFYFTQVKRFDDYSLREMGTILKHNKKGPLSYATEVVEANRGPFKSVERW